MTNELTSLMLDRAKGCLIGLAIGDALGAPAEFSDKGTFEPITNYRDGGPFNLKAGQWTDDTSQALCLADSILSDGGFRQGDFLSRMANWKQYGHNSSTGECFDIGIGTAQALLQYESTGKLPSNANSGGNGNIMRLAPVAIAYHRDNYKLQEVASLSSLTTHGHISALTCADFLSIMLRSYIVSSDCDETITYSSQTNDEVYDIDLCSVTLEKIASALTSEEKEWHNVSGFSTDTLCAAMHCFFNTDTFEQCVLTAVNLGGDTDSVGAVAGQIAGAYYGLSRIPQRFIDGLQDGDRFLTLAEQLFNLYENKDEN